MLCKGNNVRYSFWAIFFSLFSFLCVAQGYDYPYNSFSDRDPLKPLISETGQILIRDRKEVGDFLLQGILHSSEGSQAIMNGEIFNEGDVVEGYKIKKIEGATVVLEKDDKEYVLKWEGYDE